MNLPAAVAAAVLMLLRATVRVDPAANVHVGRSVDLLQRFDAVDEMLYHSLDSAEDYAITHDILQDGLAVRYTEVLNVTRNDTNKLNITFCPDLNCLFNVYFDGFLVDLSENPWKQLASSRLSHMISERFGIPDLGMGHGQQFVVISYRRPVKRFKTCDNFTQTAQLKSTVAEKLKCMTVGIESMVIDFVTEYGSHYIDEYVLGDTIFQVLVYLPVFYNRFYKTCVLNNCSESDMVMFLSPVFTEYQGQVQSVGMRYVVDRWIGSKLQVTTKSDEYTSLYMLKTQPELCDELDTLMDDQSVIGLRFRVISTLITDLVKRTWFTEIIDNHIKLREFNL